MCLSTRGNCGTGPASVKDTFTNEDSSRTLSYEIPPSGPNLKSTSTKSAPHKSEIQSDLYIPTSLPENVPFEHLSCKSHTTYCMSK